MILQLAEKLKLEMQNDLPGLSAQQLMSPSKRNYRYNGNLQVPFSKNGGVLILLYPDKSGNIRLPLIQRPDYDGAHGGQVSFPGGKHEKQDRDLVATALRETNEEIGVDPAQVHVLGIMTELYVWVSNVTVLPVLAYTTTTPTFVADESEVSEIIEVDLTWLLNKEIIKSKTLTVRGFAIDAPYYDIKQKMVWGATAMMLSELAELLKRVKFI